jgi:hypothetical protein
MGDIYEICQSNGFMWHDTQTKFYEDWYRRSSNIELITSTIMEAAVLALLMGGIFMKYAVEILSDGIIYVRLIMIGS